MVAKEKVGEPQTLDSKYSQFCPLNTSCFFSQQFSNVNVHQGTGRSCWPTSKLLTWGGGWNFRVLIFFSALLVGFLVPQPGIEPVPLAVRAQSPNPQTTREFPWISNKLPGDTDAAGLEPYFGSHLALVLDESSESLWFSVIFQL